MPVPNTFGTATSAIPLSDLDDNFAAPITIGNTAVQLGNTVTTLNNMTLANVTISSGNVTITNVGITTANVSGTANISTLAVVGNATVGGNTTITGNITAANANVTTNLVLSNGTANGVAYLNTSKQLTTGSALVFDGSQLGVGVASPSFRLDVGGGDGTNIALRSTGTSQARLRGYVNGAESGVIGFLDGGGQVFEVAGSEKMRLDSSGNLLVGTTSASYSASGRGVAVLGGSASGLLGFQIGGVAKGYVGHFDTSMQMWNEANSPILFATNAVERMRIDSNGIVTMNAYGVGTATFSAAGVISSVSDETWTIKDGVPVDTDAMLKKLEPGYWYYNDEKKEIFGADRQLGFYAQNVNAAIGPEAAPTPETIITKNQDGSETTVTKPWGYYDRSVLAITVMSLQKALATIETLTARITALEAQ